MDLYFTFLWKSALVIALFYSFYRFFLYKETYFRSNRYFLISGIIASVIIPLIIVPVYVNIESVEFSQITFDTATNSATIISNPPFNWVPLLTYIYIGITSIFLVRLIVQIISIAFLILKNGIVKKDTYYYVETEDSNSPFSFFNFIVYNPEQFTESELEQILVHEKVHALEKHSIDTLLSNIIVTLQWFNPIAWLYKKDIEQNLEFLADENAQKESISESTYQQLLLKTTVPNYQMALVNNFYNSLLKKRIIMLRKQRSDSKSQWKFALMLPLLLAFIFSFNTKTIAQKKKDKTKVHKIEVEIYAMGITKESNKEDLDEITKSFGEKGLTVKFSGLKRNNDDQITAIKIDAKAKSGKASASFASDVEEGISPIQISFDNENNSLNIGSSNRHGVHGYSFSDREHRKMIRHKGKGNSFIFHSDDDDNTRISKKGNHKVIIDIDEDHNDSDDIHEIIIEDEDGKEVKKEIIKIKGKKGKGKRIFISGDDDDENTTTTYIVNGKKMSKEEFEKMDADKIKTIEIKKETKRVKKKN